MPREYDPLKEYVINMQDDYGISWPILSGREVFKTRSITGLNKAPVETHVDYVVSDYSPEDDADDLPIPLDDIAEALVVDGSLITLLDNKGQNPELLENIFIYSLDHFIQLLGANKEWKEVTREWTLNGTKWKVQDWIYYEDEKKRKPVGNSYIISAERVYVFPNKNGLLFKAQDTFHRLEEIELRLRKATNTAIVIVVKGFVKDRQQAADAIDSEDSHVLFVGNSDVQLVANTALADQFLADFNNLFPRYADLMKIVNTSDASTMSGIARRLVMKPMLAYTERLKAQCQKIYIEAFGVELDFEQTVTRTTEEIRADYELLKQMRDDGTLSQEEFMKRAAKLLP